MMKEYDKTCIYIVVMMMAAMIIILVAHMESEKTKRMRDAGFVQVRLAELEGK